ncbi:MAG: MBL fold metallo-hydrolase [Treponema sp.]|nr:MBL fold metallo-hydrolase [Treponema sp.]
MSAIELIPNVYMIPGATNTGIIVDVVDDKKLVYLIDTGMNDKDGERILNEIDTLFPQEKGGYTLKAILNTHSHADHAGGNKFIKDKTNCEVWISYGEAGSLMNPDLQASIVCGGPIFREIQETRYLIANPCMPTNYISQNTQIFLSDGSKITFKPLPGHYFDMMGVLYTNTKGQTVFFAGDAVFGQAHILKYWIPFLYDVEQFKLTLEMLSNTYYDHYIPSHGEHITRIQETTELNMIAILSTEYCVLSELQKQELNKDELVKRIANRNEINFKLEQYALINCTINAYLAYLRDKKRIDCKIKDNQLVWYALQKKQD